MLPNSCAEHDIVVAHTLTTTIACLIMVILRELVALPPPGGAGINHLGLEDHHVVVLEDGQGATGGLNFREAPCHEYEPEEGWGMYGFAETVLGGASTGAMYSVATAVLVLALHRRRGRTTTGSQGGRRVHALL